MDDYEKIEEVENAGLLRQFREESAEPLFEVFVYDFGKSGHTCPHCGIGLSTVRCSNGCPHVLKCGEYMEHESGGEHWCPIECNEELCEEFSEVD